MADLFVYDMIANLINMYPNLLESYPDLNENRKRVESVPNLKGYLESKCRS